MKQTALVVLFVLVTFSMFGQGVTVLRTIPVDYYKSNYITMETWGNSSQIWLRNNLNMSSMGDKQLASLAIRPASNPVLDKAQICRAKKYFDAGQTILGCGSVIGTAACVATVGGMGAATPLCVSVSVYATTTGLVDCVKGLSGLIGDVLAGYGKETKLITSSMYPTVSDLISLTLDAACDDINSR